GLQIAVNQRARVEPLRDLEHRSSGSTAARSYQNGTDPLFQALRGFQHRARLDVEQAPRGEPELREEVAGGEQEAVDDVVERVAGLFCMAVELAFVREGVLEALAGDQAVDRERL